MNPLKNKQWKNDVIVVLETRSLDASLDLTTSSVNHKTGNEGERGAQKNKIKIKRRKKKESTP